MIDFILVSLPWIVIGVTIAVIIIFLTKRKKEIYAYQTVIIKTYKIQSLYITKGK